MLQTTLVGRALAAETVDYGSILGRGKPKTRENSLPWLQSPEAKHFCRSL